MGQLLPVSAENTELNYTNGPTWYKAAPSVSIALNVGVARIFVRKGRPFVGGGRTSVSYVFLWIFIDGGQLPLPAPFT